MTEMRIRKALLTALLLAPLAGCQTPAHRDGRNLESVVGPAGERPTPPEYAALNKAFRKIYADRRAGVEDNLGPIVVADFKRLQLWKNGKLVEQGVGIPDQYFRLRVSAHTPFAVYLMLKPSVGRPLSSREIAQLETYREHLDAARRVMDDGGFTPAQLERQRKIFDTTLAYLDNVRRNGRTTDDELSHYITSLHKAFMANARDAAVAQVNAMHTQMLAWRKELTDDEWAGLRVVVVSSEQARRGNVATQYFAKLLNCREKQIGYPGESTRLYYREYTPERPGNTDSYADWLHRQDRTLFATMDLDADASIAFFGNSWRMRIDVMADGARDYLKTLDFTSLTPR